MKVQYYTAASLDGFVATQDDSLDWLFALGDPEISSYPDFIRDVGAIAMGSNTYSWVRNALKTDSGAGDPWPYTQPTWVITTRSLPGVPNADIRFAQGDIRPIHAAMRTVAGEKNLWIAGGGDLVGQFHDAGLLDEIIVQIGSVTLGSGKPLLPRMIAPPALRLLSARSIGSTFAELRYAVVRSAANTASASERG